MNKTKPTSSACKPSGFYLTQGNNTMNWKEYERRKALILRKNLTSQEYQRRIAMLARELSV